MLRFEHYTTFFEVVRIAYDILKTEDEKARRRQIELAGRTKKDDYTTLVPTGVPIDIVMTKAILYSNLSNCINFDDEFVKYQ
jgi:hypothetical protein